MKLLFKQRMFSWFDSYDVYMESGEVIFTVKGVPAWGHCLKIYNTAGRQVAMVKQEVLTIMPCFRLYMGEEYVGEIKKEFTLMRPSFSLNCKGWQVKGDLFEWNYEVTDGNFMVMSAYKELWNLTDTYTIDITRDEDALYALMIVLAIDAVKCSADNN